MENLVLVLWLLGYPLVCTLDKYVYFVARKEPKPKTYDTVVLIELVFYFAVAAFLIYS